MDFGEQQRNPAKHMVGIGFVLVLHLILGWALLNGLAQRLVEVIREPLETKIIEEVKKVEPPPPENLPPPPKFAPPPPSFVPPPEVNVNPPPTPAPTITTTTVAPPPPPAVFIQPPPAPAAPPAPPAVARVAPRPVISDFKGCAPSRDDYPQPAVRAEATGTTRVQVNIDATGKITGVDVLKSAGASREHKMLDRLVVSKIMSACKATPARDDEGKAVAGSISVEYLWSLD